MGDGELIDRLRRREQSGLEELSRRYGPLMRYILSPILPDEQDREECLADVVLLVWERVDAYSPDRGAFSTWLTALTRNAAISRARKRRQDTEPLSPERASPAPGPEEQVLRRELLEDLLMARRQGVISSTSPSSGGREEAPALIRASSSWSLRF